MPHVLGYEMTKIQWASEPLPRFGAFVDITDVMETEARIDAPLQDDAARPSPHIRSLESVKALATIRGAEIGVEYAEAFSVLRTTL